MHSPQKSLRLQYARRRTISQIFRQCRQQTNIVLARFVPLSVNLSQVSEPKNEKWWGCWFLRWICCSDAFLDKLSRRSENHVLRVIHLLPRFSDTWSSMALVATLVCSNGLENSSSSFWPFPEFGNCFFLSFNDIRWCDWFHGRISVNCKSGAANTNVSSSYDRNVQHKMSAIKFCNNLVHLEVQLPYGDHVWLIIKLTGDRTFIQLLSQTCISKWNISLKMKSLLIKQV